MNHVVALLVAAAVLALIAFAYERGDLNKWLPVADQKSQSFVGVYGRYPAMQKCLQYDANGNVVFNRCTYA